MWETTCENNNLSHGKFLVFFFPFSSKFSDLNFAKYVLYIYSCYETRTWHKQWAWVTCGLRGGGWQKQAFSQAGKAKETRERGTKKMEVCRGGGGVRAVSFSSRSVLPSLVFFFSPSCFSRASPAYIKGNENECYAGSQIYDNESCIRLTEHRYRLTSEIMQSCQPGDFWRENVIIVSCHVSTK